MEEVIAGCESDEVVCLIRVLDAQVCDVETSRVMGAFRVERGIDDGELILEMYAQNEVLVCNTFFQDERYAQVHIYTRGKRRGCC